MGIEIPEDLREDYEELKQEAHELTCDERDSSYIRWIIKQIERIATLEAALKEKERDWDIAQQSYQKLNTELEHEIESRNHLQAQLTEALSDRDYFKSEAQANAERLTEAREQIEQLEEKCKSLKIQLDAANLGWA